MGPEGSAPLFARRLHRFAQPAGRFLGQQPQRVGLGFRRRRWLAQRQLARGPGVAPGPQVELQQVGGHQRQPPASDLADNHGYAHDADQQANRQPRSHRAEGEVVVGTVAQGAHRHHRHDLGEGEPQQHLVLGLHVGRDFMLSHSIPPMRRALGSGCARPAAGGVGHVGSTGLPTTAFITSSTTP